MTSGVQATLTLNATVGEAIPGHPDYDEAKATAFKAAFVSDVASALSVDSWRIVVISVTEGSTIVQFVVAPDANGNDISTLDVTNLSSDFDTLESLLFVDTLSGTVSDVEVYSPTTATEDDDETAVGAIAAGAAGGLILLLCACICCGPDALCMSTRDKIGIAKMCCNDADDEAPINKGSSDTGAV